MLFADDPVMPSAPWTVGGIGVTALAALYATAKWVTVSLDKKDAQIQAMIVSRDAMADAKDKLMREMATDFKIALGSTVDKLSTQIKETNDRMFGAFEAQNEVLGAMEKEMAAGREAYKEGMQQVRKSMEDLRSSVGLLASRVDKWDGTKKS